MALLFFYLTHKMCAYVCFERGWGYWYYFFILLRGFFDAHENVVF